MIYKLVLVTLGVTLATKINIGYYDELFSPKLHDAGEGNMKEQVVRKGKRIVYKKLQKRNSKTVMMDPRLGY